MKISVCVIATNRYKELIQPLIDSMNKYFLLDHELNVHLFTDEEKEYKTSEKINIIQHIIPAYKFPQATLYRYKIMTSIPIKNYDNYIIYLDADMRIVGKVGDEILENIVAVRHPGYYNGGGSWETNPKSMAYVEPHNRIKYFAGGLQAGKALIFYSYMKMMADFIDEDERNGIIPIWHDESIWNAVLSRLDNYTELDPSYCMPEPMNKRIAWGINHFVPKILALEKPNNFRA